MTESKRKNCELYKREPSKRPTKKSRWKSVFWRKQQKGRRSKCWVRRRPRFEINLPPRCSLRRTKAKAVRSRPPSTTNPSLLESCECRDPHPQHLLTLSRPLPLPTLWSRANFVRRPLEKRVQQYCKKRTNFGRSGQRKLGLEPETFLYRAR